MGNNYEKHLKAIGSRFKELRKSGGYSSHEKFADAHNIERKQYWRLEAGKNFTMVTLLQIVEAHKISLEDFFKEVKYTKTE